MENELRGSAANTLARIHAVLSCRVGGLARIAGQRCTFAHGDAELAPKEIRQMARREAEAATARRQQFERMLGDDQPVRQRAVADSGDDPAYEEYETLAANAGSSGSGVSNVGSMPSEAVPQTVTGTVGGSSAAAAEPQRYRQDGTPLDFSSRDAKQEALRQHALEQMYEAEQAAWGLPVPTPVAMVSAPGTGDIVTRRALPPRGRGKHMVRPAWLVRQERGQSSYT